MKITWQATSQTEENTQNFHTIRAWWDALPHKTIHWKQRVIPEIGEIDWNPQRFDETFPVAAAEVRGISLYWKKNEAEDIRNITPVKLELSPSRQQLFLYPENQANVVISVEVPRTVQNRLTMKNPVWMGEKMAEGGGTGYRVTIHDDATETAIDIEMDQGGLNALQQVVTELTR